MNGPIYTKSLFAQYFDADDPAVLAWANNVLDKLIATGVVAEFVLREDEDGNPTDFIQLFQPITIFFGYLVQLARQFDNFTDDQFLSEQYLEQHGQYGSGNETLDQLVWAIKNSLRVRAARGTDITITPSVDPNIADGEILRLVGWNSKTFFKFGTALPQYNSWNLNNSGPSCRGLTGRYDLNLAYEYTEDVEDIGVYPLINPGSVFHAFYRDRKCMEIEMPAAGQVAGIGAVVLSKAIVVDPRINIEITFSVAQDITLHNITFGCLAFDASGNQVQLESIVNNHLTNNFFEAARLNKAGHFYFVRGILFNSTEPNRTIKDAALNVGFGHNLIMPSNVVSIIPYIVYDNNRGGDSSPTDDDFASTSVSTAIEDSAASSSGDLPYDGNPSLFDWNVKVTPCSTLYGRCYINNKNFIDILYANKNGAFSDQQIYNALRRYFIPYNTAFQVTNFANLGILPNFGSFIALEQNGYVLLEDGIGRIPLEE